MTNQQIGLLVGVTGAVLYLATRPAKAVTGGASPPPGKGPPPPVPPHPTPKPPNQIDPTHIKPVGGMTQPKVLVGGDAAHPPAMGFPVVQPNVPSTPGDVNLYVNAYDQNGQPIWNTPSDGISADVTVSGQIANDIATIMNLPEFKATYWDLPDLLAGNTLLVWTTQADGTVNYWWRLSFLGLGAAASSTV